MKPSQIFLEDSEVTSKRKPSLSPQNFTKKSKSVCGQDIERPGLKEAKPTSPRLYFAKKSKAVPLNDLPSDSEVSRKETMEQNLKDLRQKYDSIDDKNSTEATRLKKTIAYIKETYENPILAPKNQSKNAKLDQKKLKKQLFNQLLAQDPILSRLEDTDDSGKFLGNSIFMVHCKFDIFFLNLRRFIKKIFFRSKNSRFKKGSLEL